MALGPLGNGTQRVFRDGSGHARKFAHDKAPMESEMGAYAVRGREKDSLAPGEDPILKELGIAQPSEAVAGNTET
ncbi:hypothetical protein P7K49_029560 [Saguinus oedipus]|uniref:Uncharacterized protein n=1 Tax=Saguinus oedipus TaxID=9490 RepID=A0ABQ9U7L2_SAGOE|nr:hypothetical protein P7K49_029560 [Saguinus oedipus]